MPPLTSGQMGTLKKTLELQWLLERARKNHAVHQDTIKAKILAAINRCFDGRATDAAIRQVAEDVGTPLIDVVQAKVAEDYSEVIGMYGRVPARVVEAICVKYTMKRDVVLQACDRMAAAQGMNGVKVVVAPPITHELKLIRMGDERVYATKMIGGVPVFDTVGKHL